MDWAPLATFLVAVGGSFGAACDSRSSMRQHAWCRRRSRVAERDERGSMLITGNRTVSEWGAVTGDTVVATAILDRLLHHSHVITSRGDRYRLLEKRRSGPIPQRSTGKVLEKLI